MSYIEIWKSKYEDVSKILYVYFIHTLHAVIPYKAKTCPVMRSDATTKLWMKY